MALWTEVPDEEATYWRVACRDCGLVVVKASRHNMRLHQLGHIKKHKGAASFEVTPLVRVPDESTKFPVYADEAD